MNTWMVKNDWEEKEYTDWVKNDLSKVRHE